MSDSSTSIHGSDTSSVTTNQTTPRTFNPPPGTQEEEENLEGSFSNVINEPPVTKMRLTEVLPKTGLVYSDRGSIAEVMCKPILLPLKSVGLQHIEEQERLAAGAGKSQEEEPSAIKIGETYGM